MTFKIEKTDDEWEDLLKNKGAEPMAYSITRHAVTERAFSGKLTSNQSTGTYRCICCDKPLFESDAKFESHCGWPSYFQPIDEAAIGSQVDGSHSMKRTEVHCADCGAHLGHVFEDGPAPTGLRYCINSGSLHFTPK